MRSVHVFAQLEQGQVQNRKKTLSTVTNLTQLSVRSCWGLTENDEANIKHSVDKWKAGSGWPREGFQEKEGETIIDSPPACALTVGSGGRGVGWGCRRSREEDGELHGGGQEGFARRVAVTSLLPPWEPWQRVSGGPSRWSHWIFDRHSPPAIGAKPPSPTNGPLPCPALSYQTKQCSQDWLKFSRSATGGDDGGRRGWRLRLLTGVQ